MGIDLSKFKSKSNPMFLNMDPSMFEEKGYLKSSFGENSNLVIVANKLSGDVYIKKTIVQGLLDNVLQAIQELKNTPPQYVFPFSR